MPSALGKAIQAAAEEVGGIRTLSLACLEALTKEHGLSRRETEITALELGVLPRRYLRNYGTMGLDGQLALLRSCVAVMGLGGLGGYAVEGLARMGVGTLVLVDGAVEVRTCAEYASPDNLPGILAVADVVVDALDRLPTRMMLQEAAAQAGVPMVHGAIAGGMGQVMTILPGDEGLRALYGDGAVPEQGAETELGTPPASPMMVAAWQVHETVKILTGRGELLRGRLLFFDAMSSEVRIFDLRNP
jgi:molybdopterin/thiamine biosynthesis adenylyltransferase